MPTYTNVRRGKRMHLTVNLPPGMADALRDIEARDERCIGDIARDAILQYIQEDRRKHDRQPIIIREPSGAIKVLDSPENS
jgi:hypothetical protein